MRRFFSAFLWLGLTFCFNSVLCRGQQDSIIDDVGDIAFVAWSSSNQDGFAFVLLDACPDSSQIKFVDEEWVGSQFYSASGEGEVTWTNTSGNLLPKGTVVIVENADNNPTASIGNADETDAGFNIASSQDQVFAFSGSRSNPKFLAMIGHTSLPNNGTGSVQTLSGTGLVSDSTAIHQTSESIYLGSTTCNGSISDCLATLNNPNNWSKISSSNTFPSSVVSGFNGSALPVELILFDAQLIPGNQVELNWSTATETNNLGFNIERLHDGIWISIGFIDGQGNSYSTTNYTFWDVDPPMNNSNIFYRLVQIDFDGKTEEMPAIKVPIEHEETTPLFSITSSLVSKNLFINTRGEKINDLFIYPINGQTVIKIRELSGIKEIYINHLKSGTYILLYTKNGASHVTKFIL